MSVPLIVAAIVFVIAFVVFYVVVSHYFDAHEDSPATWRSDIAESAMAANRRLLEGARENWADISFMARLRGYERHDVDDWIDALATGDAAYPPRFAVAAGGYDFRQVDDLVASAASSGLVAVSGDKEKASRG